MCTACVYGCSLAPSQCCHTYQSTPPSYTRYRSLSLTSFLFSPTYTTMITVCLYSIHCSCTSWSVQQYKKICNGFRKKNGCECSWAWQISWKKSCYCEANNLQVLYMKPLTICPQVVTAHSAREQTIWCLQKPQNLTWSIGHFCESVCVHILPRHFIGYTCSSAP